MGTADTWAIGERGEFHFPWTPQEITPKTRSSEWGRTVEYTSENHLTRVETTRFGATILVAYEYDAEGNRVKKTIDETVVIIYLVDTNRRLCSGAGRAR